MAAEIVPRTADAAAREAAALAALGPMERTAFRAVRWLSAGGGAPLGRVLQERILPPIFGAFVGRRLEVHGLERLRDIPPQAPILLVANHRSFFDLFALGWLFARDPATRRRFSFPVRANFFYENPLGLLLVLLFSGGTMFPPFFRDPGKRAFNAHSLEILLERLRQPGTLVGFHPEGTRNRGPDPYQLLPAQPGAGELALKARPIVVPAFINGLSNSVLSELGQNFSGRRGRRILAIFGSPVELPPAAGETRLSHHKRFADHLLQRIAQLGEEERRLRSASER